jgi:hypothetical protein
LGSFSHGASGYEDGSFLPGEAQVGHDGHLLDLQLVAVVRAFRMLEVKDERQPVFLVVRFGQVTLFVRAVGLRALAGIVNPAHKEIVVVLLAHA